MTLFRTVPHVSLLAEYALAAKLGHEFSNVLAVVHSASEGLAARGDEDGEAVLAAANKAARWTQRLTKLRVTTRDVVSPARVSDLHFAPSSVVVECSPLPEVRIAMEKRVLCEIGSELLTNAQEAEAKTLRLSVVSVSDTVQIAFEDDGHGVHPDIRARVFEPLVTTRLPARGRGVGLCIIDANLRACGGSIVLEGSASGTRVTITVPKA